MIDNSARRKLAEAIRALVAGRITNDQFEDRVWATCAETDDPAVYQVYLQGAWGLYSDLWEHRLIGSERVPRNVRRHVARWILFLRTDKPYEWPVLSPGRELADTLAGMATLGIYTRFKRRRFSKFGDIAVWPFLDQRGYEVALQAVTTG